MKKTIGVLVVFMVLLVPAVPAVSHNDGWIIGALEQLMKQNIDMRYQIEDLEKRMDNLEFKSLR
jgi:hypothetical protein